jgi:hypothetical protein
MVSYLKYIPNIVNIVFSIACNITITNIVSYYFNIISSIELTNEGIAYPICSSSSLSLSTYRWVIRICASLL